MVTQRRPTIFAGLLLTLISVSGCSRTAPVKSVEKATAADSTIWLEEGLEFEGATIAFGHRGQQAVAGEWLEPTVAITKDGKPVADAMVFYQLVTPDGMSTLGDEVATVFEQASDGTPACYAQGKLQLPGEGRSVAVRVRIVLPEVDKEWSRDFIVPQGSESTASQ
ncbi:MAG: hypothetical protein ABI614_09750 [Planctomycetota bacterium]